MPKFIIGVVILGMGIVLVLRHLHVWRRGINEASTDRQRAFLNQQVRRRCVASSGIALLGVLLASLYWATDPWTVSVLIIAALLLLLIIFVLAVVDMVSIRFLLADEGRGVKKAREALHDEYERLRRLAKRAAKEKQNERESIEDGNDKR